MGPVTDRLSIIVVGASGDLARKKIYPALFALYCQGFLPENVNIVGFARSVLSTLEFRNRISIALTCRYAPVENCEASTRSFLDRCSYVQGEYGSRDSFLDLYDQLKNMEGGGAVNRMFFLAVPADMYLAAIGSIGGAGLVACDRKYPWSRIVIEKPFGRDRLSSDTLVEEIGKVFIEDQTFRIDHYLGKEVIQNLMVLRFANTIFEPLWNREFIQDVRITWKEDFGCEGRGGYFDRYGIIRDVMQNHLLQMLALTTMSRPASVKSLDVRNAKVDLLGKIVPVSMEDVVIGQYIRSSSNPAKLAYRDDKTVAAGSVTPTFASAVLHINDSRWEGVPFLVTAGKALDARMTEICIRFRQVPGNLFCSTGKCPEQNELVVRVQPDESINFRIASKVPGLDLRIEPRTLDLRYASAFSQMIPDAYECLLLDVLRGDRGLFIRKDELEASWNVFTPVLQRIDDLKVKPEFYEYGSAGPVAAVELSRRYGF